MNIIINRRQIQIDKTHLSYQEIVDLADSGRSKEALHSIVYKARGTGDWERNGLLGPKDEPLEICDGMVITALVTDNA